MFGGKPVAEKQALLRERMARHRSWTGVPAVRERQREYRAFGRMGEYLKGQAPGAERVERELRAERRYNAFHSVRTSWRWVERAEFYCMAPLVARGRGIGRLVA